MVPKDFFHRPESRKGFRPSFRKDVLFFKGYGWLSIVDSNALKALHVTFGIFESIRLVVLTFCWGVVASNGKANRVTMHSL